MPALEEALFDYLTNDPGVSGLVDDRVYPGRLPEGTNASPLPLPAISYARVSASRTYTYDSYAETAAWVRARVQFSCWDATPLGSIQLGEAVLLALSGYNGDMSGQPVGSSSAEVELDNYEPAVKLHRRILDFFITYEDPSTTS